MLSILKMERVTLSSQTSGIFSTRNAINTRLVSILTTRRHIKPQRALKAGGEQQAAKRVPAPPGLPGDKPNGDSSARFHPKQLNPANYNWNTNHSRIPHVGTEHLEKLVLLELVWVYIKTQLIIWIKKKVLKIKQANYMFMLS